MGDMNGSYLEVLMSKKAKYLFLVPIVLFLLYWCVSLAKCEILTKIHGEEFEEVDLTEVMLVDADYWKVLSYREDYAEVYFVSPEGKGGTVLHLLRDGDTWIIGEWGPYWSATGSADDIIWPYIR